LYWKGEIITKCPSCESSRIEKSGIRKDSAIVFKCNDCELGFLNPMPLPNEINEFYHDYYTRSDGIGYTTYDIIGDYSWLDYYLLTRLKEFGIYPGLMVLDIGCAYGNKVHFLRANGFQARGIDLSEEATANGRLNYGLDLQKSSLENYSTLERFDAIIMMSFIEHVRNPKIWADKVSELLKPNGVVVITTPNFSLHSKVGDKWSGFQTSFEHLYFFSPYSLRSLLDRSGIMVEFESSLKTMPIILNEGDRVHRMANIFRVLKKLDSNMEHIPKHLFGIWRKAMDRVLYNRFAGNVTENHQIFILARKAR
jgi:2-polyprenyl-3-methyl-5-hydroxy-6-metoxy-1,4-benzoquinol methylase